MDEIKHTPVSEKLRTLRSAYHMTQNEVAEVLGMSRTSFSKYENGATLPPLKVLRKLAKVYNVPLEYLIHDNSTSVVLHDSKSETAPDIDNLAESFAQLTSEEKMIIMKLRLMSKEEKSAFLSNLSDNNEE